MNYLFLLEKKQAKSFFNENSDRIFGQKNKIEVLKIKRYKTFNEESSLNVYYELNVNGTEWKLRTSTSTFLVKEHDFNVMSYFYQNNFDKGHFTVPQPVAYLKEERILIYKDVVGQKLSDILSQNTNFEKYIKDCATLAKKVHSLKIPSFPLFDPDFLFKDFKFEVVATKFPKARNLSSIIQMIKSNLPKEKAHTFCHGDFNPNNLIIDGNNICLIDFGMTSVFYKEIDIASFLAHSRIMLEANPDLYQKLKDTFLNSYGDFNMKNLYLLMALIDARLLEISTIFQNSYDSDQIFKYLSEDLKAIIENES